MAELNCFAVRLNVGEKWKNKNGKKQGGEYVNIAGFLPQIRGAQAGQYLEIEEVDSQGRVTKFKSVEAPKFDSPDWNAKEGEPSHVLNRTHYVEVVAQNVVFDGNLDGREYFPVSADGSQMLVKVSNEILSASDLVGRTLTVNLAGQITSVVLSESDIVDYNAYAMALCSVKLTIPQGTFEVVYCVSDNVTTQGMTFEPGVYFGYMATGEAVMYVKSLSNLKNTVEEVYKLDNKFIDAEWMATNVETVIVPPRQYVFEDSHRSDAAQTWNYNDPIMLLGNKLVLGQTYDVWVDGTKHTLPCVALPVDDISAFVLGDVSDDNSVHVICVDGKNAGVDQILVTTLPGTITGPVTVKITKTEFAKLPEKFLPEGYRKEELVAAVIAALPGAEEVSF